jgi:hypothetical protein
MRLVLDNLQAEQAKQELKGAVELLPRVARECYKWLLCPSQENPTDKPSVEVAPLNTSGAALGAEIERVCLDNEWVITTWSPIHLRTKLKQLYWKADKPTKKATEFWEDTLRYIYLPRLKDRGVLAQAIVKGAATSDFFGTAYGEHDGKFDGFKLGDANVQFDDTLLLCEPEAAKAYAAANQPAVPSGVTPPDSVPPGGTPPVATGTGQTPPGPTGTGPTPPGRTTSAPKAKSFHGSAEVAPAAARMRLVQIADEIIALLASDPNATLNITVEINAEFPLGASDAIKRAVTENATTLGFKTKAWE